MFQQNLPVLKIGCRWPTQADLRNCCKMVIIVILFERRLDIR